MNVFRKASTNLTDSHADLKGSEMRVQKSTKITFYSDDHAVCSLPSQNRIEFFVNAARLQGSSISIKKLGHYRILFHFIFDYGVSVARLH